MATKLKKGRPRKQFFSKLDAIIEEAKAITLDQPTSTAKKEKKRETTGICYGGRQFFSELDDGEKKKREKTRIELDDGEKKKREKTRIELDDGEKTRIELDDEEKKRQETTGICCGGRQFFSELDNGDDDFDCIEVKSTLTEPRSPVFTLAPGTILATQLNAFVPSVFPRRNEYITTVLDEIGLQLPSPLDSLDLPSNMEHLLGQAPMDYLWKTTLSSGTPVTHFLAPPVDTCLSCVKPLHVHNNPVRVICYTPNGPLPAIKITLRCKSCGLNYRYDQYGSTKCGGYRYYCDRRPYVQATQVCYVHRQTCELWAASSHHAWVSFEASAEIYNEVCREIKNENYINLSMYLEEYPLSQKDSSDIPSLCEKHSKTVAAAFWTHQLEEELRECDMADYLFIDSNSREVCMEEIDCKRAKTGYIHATDDCCEECRRRGCGRLWSMDGNWKIRYPVCMYPTPKDTVAFRGNLKYVDTCPSSPAYGKAFCEHHCEVASRCGIPSDIRGYLAYIGAVKPSEKSATTAADCQGTASIIGQHSRLVQITDTTEEVEESRTTCNKDTGEKRTLQKWTRGTWFCVGGGGHISAWQPLYQSEGPAQVFLLVVAWLITTFGHMKREQWRKIVLAYDNMCHVDNLRVAQSPLPLPGRLKHIWHDINKIIDDLHLRNHKDARCAEKYCSSTVRGEIPDMNTMSCEQTFAWLSCFKKILCTMTKTHHHFYLHRLVKRRNNYITYCYKNRRRPLQPKPKISRVD